MHALEIEQLTVSFDKTPVLWDINFSLPTGRLCAVVGPNGAGKSTLLQAILGIVKPLSGTIRLLGEEARKVQARVAYVPQRSSVDWNFPISVLDVVLMGRYRKLGLFKWPRASDRDAARSILKKVGMLEYESRQISQLSGGQKQRLFIARALLQQADLFLLDEPFAGVDMATEKEILELLGKLKQEGKTLLVVHHDLSTVQNYFDWALLLNTALVASGPMEEVFHQANIFRAFGKRHALLEEVARLSGDVL